MSVANEKNVLRYPADGTVGPYPYDFRIDTDTDLLVIETDTTTGGELTKTINTHYTVSGVGVAGGGNVTFISPFQPALGKRLTLARQVTATQPVDIPLNGPIPSNSVELQMDKLAFLAQQQNRSIERCIQTPITDPAAPIKLASKEVRASKYFAFDVNGDPVFLSSAIASTTPVSAFGATVVDDTNADAMVKTIVDGATAETVIASGDLFLIKDVSANTGRKITLEDIYKGLNVLTEDTAPIHNTDFLLEYDVSAGTVKKSKFSNWRSNSYYVHNAALPAAGLYDIIGIPAGIRRLTIGLINASLAGADTFLLQLGDSGGIETTGYGGSYALIVNAATPTVAAHPTGSGFGFGQFAAADLVYGQLILTRVNGLTRWIISGSVTTDTGKVVTLGGQKDLSAELDRIRLTRTGANNFDGGGIDVIGEF